ncbi:hypothetical protein MG296_11085 [Flavobacteriaceae bacterium TK19130]|nr:hypothetical protein [Thermobacterium salinum]
MKHLSILFSLFFLLSISCYGQDTVYVTKTGEKYHVENCKYLKYSSIQKTFEEAIDLGYTACKVCKPSRNASATTPNQITPEKEKETTTTSTNSRRTYAVQCSGRTQSGRRCKRKTKNASGRCYQH